MGVSNFGGGRDDMEKDLFFLKKLGRVESRPPTRSIQDELPNRNDSNQAATHRSIGEWNRRDRREGGVKMGRRLLTSRSSLK
ncbi:hypothetical protein LINPERPRIM_LOCUS2254 [Linum perenne]